MSLAIDAGEQLLEANKLLASLRPDDRALIAPHLRTGKVEREQVLFDCGEPVRTIFFPCDQAIVSLVLPMDPGHVVEVAAIGREGAVGGVISHGFLPAYTRALVQHPGPCLRLPLASLQSAKDQSPGMRSLFTRYSDCLLAQVLQSVACNALHSVDNRCAKWLLSTSDRTGSLAIELTHEALAEMLGVQRSYVSKVLGRFQRQNMIRIARGRIELIDPESLEAASCDCYDRVCTHFDSVLNGVYPEPPQGRTVRNCDPD